MQVSADLKSGEHVFQVCLPKDLPSICSNFNTSTENPIKSIFLVARPLLANSTEKVKSFFFVGEQDARRFSVGTV